jgi:serine/threonine-protein kinase
MTDPELVGRTLQLLQPLLFHPEPLVWVHAARALGRLTGSLEQMEGTLLDWVLGESPILRQRALTAFASLPAERLAFLGGQLIAILDGPDEQGWVLAAISAATPYLFFERRLLWDRLAKRVLDKGDGGAIAARAMARGLATLWRRGLRDAPIEKSLRTLRERARHARTDSLDESRRWIEVIAWTDIIDNAERDPLDLELGLENLVRLAAQYDDEEADARAARFAISVMPTFVEARRIALGPGRIRQRAAALNALEACARAFALRLWGPLLATRPGDVPIEVPELEETWKMIARAPAELLDLVKERRAEGVDDLALEVLAVRLGGYALDACGEDAELGPGRGPTAHDTCLWLRKLEGLADGSRDLPPPLRNALSVLFWRLVDTTRGTALGEVDDQQWLGPFAAWWALVIDRPAMLQQLATALPMMAPGALTKCCEHAEALRTAVSSGAPNGTWGRLAAASLKELHAQPTELGQALSGLARALYEFSTAAGPKENLEAMCLALVLAGDRLQSALADPVRALHDATAETGDDSLSRRATENAPRVAALVARAIRAREIGMLDVWLASLGPAASALLEGAIKAAIQRTPAPPPVQKHEPKLVEGYELVKPLGEGGIGSVWLVRKPGADRLFVLKIPKSDALAQANDLEREGILTSFVEEAKALAGLYHPNVANIIDRGVVQGTVPFLVLEYLIGADLRQYSMARLMSLFELRQVVLESCAGLAALHSAGLVHRDIKPANLWLRLPLRGGESAFAPTPSRSPSSFERRRRVLRAIVRTRSSSAESSRARSEPFDPLGSPHAGNLRGGFCPRHDDGDARARSNPERRDAFPSREQTRRGARDRRSIADNRRLDRGRSRARRRARRRAESGRNVGRRLERDLRGLARRARSSLDRHARRRARASRGCRGKCRRSGGRRRASDRRRGSPLALRVRARLGVARRGHRIFRDRSRHAARARSRVPHAHGVRRRARNPRTKPRRRDELRRGRDRARDHHRERRERRFRRLGDVAPQLWHRTLLHGAPLSRAPARRSIAPSRRAARAPRGVLDARIGRERDNAAAVVEAGTYIATALMVSQL